MSTAMPHDLARQAGHAAIREFFGSRRGVTAIHGPRHPLSEITHSPRLVGPWDRASCRVERAAVFEVRGLFTPPTTAACSPLLDKRAGRARTSASISSLPRSCCRRSQRFRLQSRIAPTLRFEGGRIIDYVPTSSTQRQRIPSRILVEREPRRRTQRRRSAASRLRTRYIAFLCSIAHGTDGPVRGRGGRRPCDPTFLARRASQDHHGTRATSRKPERRAEPARMKSITVDVAAEARLASSSPPGLHFAVSLLKPTTPLPRAGWVQHAAQAVALIRGEAPLVGTGIERVPPLFRRGRALQARRHRGSATPSASIVRVESDQLRVSSVKSERTSIP